MFYSRTQMYARGVSGRIASLHHTRTLLPSMKAFNWDGRIEQFYIVRFRQKDLWEEYPCENDTCRPSSRIGGSSPV